MKEEIQKILDRNFKRGDNTKALEELCILFNVSVSVCETCDWVDFPDKTAICKKCGTTSLF